MSFPKPILLGALCIGLLTSCGSDSTTSATNADPGTNNVPKAIVPVLDTNSYGVPWNKAVTYGTLTDVRDGKIYQTVDIGDSVYHLTWMARNLDYKGTGADTIGHCFENVADSCAKYGRLYTWTEAMKLAKTFDTTAWTGAMQKHQGICPAGWHISSGDDWNFIQNKADKTGNFKDTSLVSTQGWSITKGTDLFGFRALPGGYRDTSGLYFANGAAGEWWKSHDQSDTTAWTIWLSASGSSYNGIISKASGASVRCVKDKN